jgi:hypothetical protein
MKNDKLLVWIGLAIGAVGYFLLVTYGGWQVGAGVCLVHWYINVERNAAISLALARLTQAVCGKPAGPLTKHYTPQDNEAADTHI